MSDPLGFILVILGMFIGYGLVKRLRADKEEKIEDE